MLEKSLFLVLKCHFLAEKLKSAEQIVLTRTLTALKCHFLTFLCQQTWLSAVNNLADFVFELMHQRLWKVANPGRWPVLWIREAKVLILSRMFSFLD